MRFNSTTRDEKRRRAIPREWFLLPSPSSRLGRAVEADTEESRGSCLDWSLPFEENERAEMEEEVES
jgi:hypothetical protein